MLRVITRPTDNKVVWSWDSTEAFGNNLPNENPSALGTFTYNLRMPGQQWDKETGTFYNYFRDYDPSLGRYVQSDPLGVVFFRRLSKKKLTPEDLQLNHLYSYVDSDPLNFIDPFELAATTAGGFGRFVGGVAAGGGRGAIGGWAGAGVGALIGGAAVILSCEPTAR